MYSRPAASLSSLLTFAIVSFTRYSLWPWILIYLYSRKYESWAQVVVAYGLLLSSLHLGIYLGQLTAAQCRQLSRAFYILIFTALTSAYSSIAFVSRFPLTVVLFWTVGFMGSILMVNAEGGGDKKSSSLLSAAPHKEQDLDSSLQTQRTLVVFIFSTLLAGFLYDSRPHIDFPCYNLSILLTVACLGMTAYRIIRRSRSKKQHNHHHHKHPIRKPTTKHAGASGLDISSFEDKGEIKAMDVPGDVALNFLSACRGDLAKAKQTYGKMLAWRKLYHLDNIFDIPQPTFHDIIKYYPHAIHGYSLDGCVVVYEILGKGKPNELKATGVSIDDLVWHFNLRNELIFNHLASVEKVAEISRKSPPGAITPTPFPYHAESGALKDHVPRMMTVIDVDGISISSVTTEVISFIKKSGEVIDNYYPEQVARLVICRAPRWFSTIWTIIARVLPETVQKKVDILYDAKGLDKYIHPSQRSREYGGTDVDLGQSEGHLAFLKLAEAWKLDELSGNEDAGNDKKVKDGKLTRQVSGSSKGGSEGVNDGIAAGSNGPSTPFARGRGMLNWLSSRFRKPQSAFLGEKNTYRFNEGTGKWEMELDLEGGRSTTGFRESVDESDSSTDEEDEDIASSIPRTPSFDVRDGRRVGRRKKKMTKEQLEEHGLVLAIHAAHYASKYAKLSGTEGGLSPHGFNANQFASNANLTNIGSMPSSANLNSDYGNMRGVSMSSMMLSNLDNNEANSMENKDYNTNTNSNSAGNNPALGTSKSSSYIFLLVSSIFILITNCHIMLLTLLPVWLTAPLKSGGLGYGVRDLGLLGSFSGLMVLHAQILLGSKFEHVLKASPVRALRIGCGIATVVLFLLPMYVRHYTIPLEDILHHHHDPTRNDAGIGIHHSAHHGSTFYQFIEEDVQVYLSYLLPSLSITSLLVQSLLISTLICASFLCRKASGMLLHLILGTSFNSPVMIRYALHAVGDVTGPFLSAVVYSIIYGSRLKYPMNSSFFLPLTACGSLLAYILSLYIVVQFRGDYGVMSDHQELKALLWEESHEVRGGNTVNSAANNEDDSSDEEAPTPLQPGSSKTNTVQGLHQRFGTSTGGASNNDSTSGSSKGHKMGLKLSKESITECAARQPEESIFYIPLGDISLLFSSMTHGYGSKLYNLKDDFKDV